MSDIPDPPSPRLTPLVWAVSAKSDYDDLPDAIKRSFGFALLFVQGGHKPGIAKPWKGLGSKVLELVEDDAAGTYRCVYTVRFKRAVYVLHAFVKKSTSGIKTSKQDIDLIERRLRWAEEHYKNHYGEDDHEEPGESGRGGRRPGGHRR